VTAKARIVITTEKCKACGLCVAFCPQHLIRLSEEIDQRGFHPAVSGDTDGCTGCANCAVMCPEVAIKVYR
jgi:2-oxoglutarate ferredoxin oxidoreductase subunit delta